MVRRCAAVVPATEWLAPRYRQLHDRVVVLDQLIPACQTVSSPPPFRAAPTPWCSPAGHVPNRGVLEAIQAMAILQRRGIAVSLELAGTPITPEYLNELMREAERLGVRANINYHGASVPGAEIDGCSKPVESA